MTVLQTRSSKAQQSALSAIIIRLKTDLPAALPPRSLNAAAPNSSHQPAVQTNVT